MKNPLEVLECERGYGQISVGNNVRVRRLVKTKILDFEFEGLDYSPAFAIG